MILSIALSAAGPLPARAATTTTFAAPYASAAVEKQSTTPGLPLTEASASADAAAATGDIALDAKADSSNPVADFASVSSQVRAIVTLPPVTSISGTVGIVARFVGSVHAYRTSTLGSGEASVIASSVCVTAAGSCGSATQDLVHVGNATALAVARDDHRARAESFVVPFETDAAVCSSESRTLQLSVAVTARADVGQVSSAHAGAALTLSSVEVTDLPCIPPVNDGAVAVRDNVFDPGDVTLRTGGAVTWTWLGGGVHTVTADDGSFDSGSAQSDGTFVATFATAGERRYFCRIHGAPGGIGMSGIVRAG